MIERKAKSALQELVDSFNEKYGNYVGARFINQDVAEQAARAARTLVKTMVDLQIVNDDAYTKAFKKAQQDELDQEEDAD